jgi:hypothetical protein
MKISASAEAFASYHSAKKGVVAAESEEEP